MLAEGPGSSRDIPIDFHQRLQLDGELFVESLAGKLELTRSKDGILARGRLRVAHQRDCDRCLELFDHHFYVEIAEIFAYPPDANVSEFSVDGSGEIDLAPLLREEVLIETSYRAICRDDCRGLSAVSGANLNELPDNEFAEMRESMNGGIDPRLAVLQDLLK